MAERIAARDNDLARTVTEALEKFEATPVAERPAAADSVAHTLAKTIQGEGPLAYRPLERLPQKWVSALSNASVNELASAIAPQPRRAPPRFLSAYLDATQSADKVASTVTRVEFQRLSPPERLLLIEKIGSASEAAQIAFVHQCLSPPDQHALQVSLQVSRLCSSAACALLGDENLAYWKAHGAACKRVLAVALSAPQEIVSPILKNLLGALSPADRADIAHGMLDAPLSEPDIVNLAQLLGCTRQASAQDIATAADTFGRLSDADIDFLRASVNPFHASNIVSAMVEQLRADPGVAQSLKERLAGFPPSNVPI